MIRDKEKYQLAIQMRKAGSSYTEIVRRLGVSKGTLGYWFSQQVWSKQVTEKLNTKWGEISRQKILLMNSERKRKTLKRYQHIQEMARQEFTTLVQNPLFLAGLCLYWGEGTKSEDGKVAVINSDVNLLQVIARFYREVLHIKESKIRLEMFIYADQNEAKIKTYWSEKLHISQTQFIKTQILPSRSTLTKRKVPYGMCSVYFSNTEMSIKIREWIKVLAKHMRK